MKCEFEPKSASDLCLFEE